MGDEIKVRNGAARSVSRAAPVRGDGRERRRRRERFVQREEGLL